MKFKLIVAFLSLFAGINGAFGASFDCAKAKKPLEKFICSTPELDRADEQMGQVFKDVNSTFPLKGFVITTQRVFLSGYSSCMMDRTGKLVANSATASACVKAVQSRIGELRQYGQAKVYSNASGKFTQDNLAILVYPKEGKNFIQFWGNWMPDAFQPEPFPAGHLCSLEGKLTPTLGGFKTDVTDDAVIAISDNAVKLSGWISCTPRTGIGEGVYKRFN